MPLVVDHEARRIHVADVAASLIARQGMAALTFREVAVAAGYSTAIVSHYFASKRDLLLFTYRTAASRTASRFDAAASEGGNLQSCLEAYLPLDHERRGDWRVWFAFWSMAIADAEFAAEQRRQVRKALERIEAVVAEQGASRDGISSADRAQQLLTIVMGVAVQAAFDAKAWPAQRQRTCVAAELKR